MAEPDAERLGAGLDRFDALAIAVSGGVDCMTLASFAHRRRPRRGHHGPCRLARRAGRGDARACARHRERARLGAYRWPTPASSTTRATAPIRSTAAISARPTSTTASARSPTAPIASGANLDDLGDYRPGLIAAAEHGVVHPFVEAGMTRPTSARLRAQLGLGDDLAELPAQPCLVQPGRDRHRHRCRDLAFVERCERRLRPLAPSGATLRCRITHAGVVLEVGGGRRRAAGGLGHAMIALCSRRRAALRGRPALSPRLDVRPAA